MARILISMKDTFLKSIDEIAEKEHRTRSELIREALRNYMQKQNQRINPNAQKNAMILENLLD